MIVRLTRESVAAGDDCFAPHLQEFSVADGTSLLEIVRHVKRNCLASIWSGRATWSVFSILPVAIVTQQDDEPIVLHQDQYFGLRYLDFSEGVLKLHVNYHGDWDRDDATSRVKQIRRTTIYE